MERLLKKLKIKVKVFERRGNSIEDIWEIAAGEETTLDRKSFEAFLKDACGLPLTDSDVAGLLNRLDANNDDEIDFDEFLSGIRGPMNEQRRRLVQMAFQKMDKINAEVFTLTYGSMVQQLLKVSLLYTCTLRRAPQNVVRHT